MNIGMVIGVGRQGYPDICGSGCASSQGVQVLESILGSDHPMTLRAGVRHASNLDRAHRTDEAREVVWHILPDVRAVLGPDHPRTLEAEALLEK